MRNVAVNKTVEAPVEEIEEHPGHLEEIHKEIVSSDNAFCESVRSKISI